MSSQLMLAPGMMAPLPMLGSGAHLRLGQLPSRLQPAAIHANGGGLPGGMLLAQAPPRQPAPPHAGADVDSLLNKPSVQDRVKTERCAMAPWG